LFTWFNKAEKNKECQGGILDAQKMGFLILILGGIFIAAGI